MALESAMPDAEAVIASRGKGDRVDPSELQSRAKVVEQTLGAVLKAGLPRSDPVVGNAKRLLNSLDEMRIKVRQLLCVRRGIHVAHPPLTHARAHSLN